MKKIILTITALVSLFFGLITVFTSAAVLFDWFGIREQQGNYVPFVVTGNFLIGFLYFLIAYGFFKRREWTPPLLFGVVSALALLFSAFLMHVYFGGVFETRTVYAFTFRILFTGLLGFVSWFLIRNSAE